jgi:uncharacterized membrane protein
MSRVWNFVYWLQARLWLIPAVMSLAALGLAYLLIGPGFEALDQFTDRWWLYSGDAGTARDLLSTLLAGMITMTSLVVSITVVVLSLAASQLGPRLIYNFIEDRRIQTVIGLFVATILYTLLALRTIGDELGGEAAVPHVVVTVASALTVSCMFALLFHINLIAHAIVSDTIVSDVADALDAEAERLPEPSQSQPVTDAEMNSYRHRCSGAIGKSGYIQVIDYRSLYNLACEHDLLVVLHVRAGHFVLRDAVHFEVHSNEPVSDDVMDRISAVVVVGSGRTPTQDLEFSVRQLVEIALRALSPALNDPYTAIAVIDRLASSLEIVSSRSMPTSRFRDDAGRIRLIADATDYEGLLDAAFNQIRQSAASNPSVLIGLARRLGDLLRVATAPEQTQAITKHLEMIRRATDTVSEPVDRDALLKAVDRARAGNGPPSAKPVVASKA